MNIQFKLLVSIIFTVFFLSACAFSSVTVYWANVEFANVKNVDAIDLFFEYPDEAVLTSDYLFYQSCKVFFGDSGNLVMENEPDKHDISDENYVYDAWYNEKKLIAYSVLVENYSYKFWILSDKDLSFCVPFVDEIASSLSENIVYKNKRYNFLLNLPINYSVEYFMNNAGLSLKNDNVEIVVMPIDNIFDYSSLGAFINQKYEGFSLEFVEYDDIYGVYINEGKGDNAIRHFFSMPDDNSFIFEAYLKIPSNMYSDYKNDFDLMMQSLVL